MSFRPRLRLALGHLSASPPPVYCYLRTFRGWSVLERPHSRGNLDVVRSTSPGSESPVRRSRFHWPGSFTSMPVLADRLCGFFYRLLQFEWESSALGKPACGVHRNALQRDHHGHRRYSTLRLQPLVWIAAFGSGARLGEWNDLWNSNHHRRLQLRSSSNGCERLVRLELLPDHRCESRVDRSDGESLDCHSYVICDDAIHRRRHQHIEHCRHLVGYAGNHQQQWSVSGSLRHQQHFRHGHSDQRSGYDLIWKSHAHHYARSG